MQKRNLIRLGIILVTILAGIWLLAYQPQPAAEMVDRQHALQAFAPAGEGGSIAGTDTAVTGQRVEFEPVMPTVVNMAEVVIDTTNGDSMYEQWQRGEIDLDENDGLISDVEKAALQEAARNMGPTAGVQIAQSGPGLRAPTAGFSFASMDYTDGGGSVPPDPEMAAGPNHVIAVVNVAVAMYNKITGTAVLGPTAAGNLFSNSSCTSGLYDPNVLYDEEADRWILAYDRGARSTTGGYCLLASQSGDPTGLWNEYFFPFNDSSAWLDYPHAGVGDSFIFMGGNYYDYSTPVSQFVESRIHAFNKADLYAGNLVTVITQGLGVGVDTPQPLNLHGFSTGTWPSFGNTHYFLGEPFDGANYTMLEWDTATLTNHGNINLGSGGFPVDVVQNGGSNIRANDWRPQDFEYRNGYGWTTMTISCNPGSGVVDCVRWAQIDLSSSSPPTLGPAGSGVYSSNGDYRFFPDLAVNHCDDMAIGYTKSSSTMFPSIWYTGRESGDPPNTLQAEAQLKAGEIAYVAFDPVPHRWGDYTGMTIDPDGTTFWYLGEYSKNTGTTAGRWGTYIGSMSFSNCNAPSTFARISVAPNPLTSPQAPDVSITRTLLISNTGSLDLLWTIDEDNATGSTTDLVSPGAGNLDSTGADAVDIEIVDALPLSLPIDSLLSGAETWPQAPAAVVNLTVDDGGINSVFGVGGSFLWLNRFSPSAGEFPFELEEIWVYFYDGFGVDVGEALQLYVYTDTDGDGNISDATLVNAYNATVGAVNAFNVYALPSPLLFTGPGDVLIGVYNTTVGTGSGEAPAAKDNTSSQQRSWIGIGSTPGNLSNMSLSLIDNYGAGYPGNWMVRGVGQTVVLDPVCDTPTDIPWLSLSPASGTTISQTASPVDVTFDSTGLTTGVYSATLCINSNAVNESQVTVPVTMTVCAAPAAVTDVAISQSGSDAILTWTGTGAAAYQVYRGNNAPYFAPGPGNLIGTTAGTTFTDVGATGSPGSNYSYIVLAADPCGSGSVTSGNSNRTGEFDFTIVPGT